MDRLPVVARLGLVALVAACDAPAGAPIERVQSVRAEPTRAARPEDFCDVVANRNSARPFRFPALAAPAPPPAAGHWRWINVWATWCVPCVEEIPMLVDWQARAAKDGAAFDLVLLSLDVDDATVDHFRRQHPRAPSTLRIADPEKAEEWLVSLGLDRGATLPVHLFVDPRGAIRCARSGGVGRTHAAVVRRILSGP